MTPHTETQEAFLIEFKALLLKYNVDICLEECGRDYYVDHKIVIDFNNYIDGESIDIGSGTITKVETGEVIL